MAVGRGAGGDARDRGLPDTVNDAIRSPQDDKPFGRGIGYSAPVCPGDFNQAISLMPSARKPLLPGLPDPPPQIRSSS
jgi:hypothetical protein